MAKPKAVSSLAEKELDKAESQLNAFESNIKEMTLDRMNAAPKEESKPQVQLSQKDIEKSADIYLKPKRAIGSREKFNEDYREQYNFAKEYVYFTAQNNEIIGEALEFWTKPFAGVPAEEWHIPVNKPIWAPRYVAEQIKACKYHRFTMKDHVTTGGDQKGNQYYGSMAVDTTIQRLDAMPTSQKKSVFMGSSGF